MLEDGSVQVSGFTGGFSESAKRLDGDRSDAWDVHDRALGMQRKGADVVLLCVGDPDFRTPEPIIDNAVSYLRVGRTHYSPSLGEMKLRRAVADWETQTSPHPCTAREVAIFPGATAAVHGVMSCLLNEGDEVIIPEPMYVGYPPVMQRIGARIVPVALDGAAGFKLNLDAIKDAVTERTRVVFVNTPGNPTGTILHRDTLSELAAWCLDQNLWLVCDEVYSMFTYEGVHRSLRASAERLDNIVMIDGLSKSHAMSGWRVGWVVAPVHFIHHLGHFLNATQFGITQFIQDASAFALENDQVYVAEMREEYRERRDYVLRRLSEVQGLRCHSPQAGMFIMCDVSGLGMNGKQFAEDLLDVARVSVVPGHAFGESISCYVRIGLAQPRDVLSKGCERIARYVADLR